MMSKVKNVRYRSERRAVLHKTAEALHRVGVFDKATMRDFDAACLTLVEQLTGKDIQRMRKREGVSQAIFARHLNVKTKLVSEWERGEKKPSGPSLKLLSLVKAKGLDAIA
jgi:putative transcriptional regulator